MIDPKENERIIDPACGTGGFLVQTLAHLIAKFEEDAQISKETETTEQFLTVNQRLKAYASRSVFGADFDPFLIKASQMNMVMAGDGHGHLYNINTLEFPKGHLSDLDTAKHEFALASRNEELAFDIVVTNPPFGSDIPVTDRHILEQYELARQWEATEDGQFRNKGTLQSSVTPEILFIERCIQLLKPGGRLAIVLPNGLLGSPGSEYIRWWILDKTWVLASVELPVEVFIVEANVNIQTSILFLKKKTEEERMAAKIGEAPEYPIFMAVAENVGFDRRGNTLYKRHPNGEDVVQEVKVKETIQTGGGPVTRELTRKQKILDDDLPEIAERYREFVRENADQFPHLRNV
jgi:type I restriction enzyme M protein